MCERLPEASPYRGNVGMWQLPPELSRKVAAAKRFVCNAAQCMNMPNPDLSTIL
jgi:hypothetical protein